MNKPTTAEALKIARDALDDIYDHTLEGMTGDTAWKALAATAETNTNKVGEAMDIVRDAVTEDFAYAWSWHCNLAMAFYDSGVDHKTANEGAARFMQILFGVDTKENQNFKVDDTADVQDRTLSDEVDRLKNENLRLKDILRKHNDDFEIRISYKDFHIKEVISSVYVDAIIKDKYAILGKIAARMSSDVIRAAKEQST
jgi:hypothetical protein